MNDVFFRLFFLIFFLAGVISCKNSDTTGQDSLNDSAIFKSDAPTSVALASTESTATHKKLFLAVDGSDDNNGDFENPLKTLMKAFELAEKDIASRDVTIYVSPGTYDNQYSYITKEEGTSPEYNLTVTAYDPADRPIFDGNGETFAFFRLHGSWNKKTNLHFSNLIVQRYNEGITFTGVRNGGYNSHNSIKRCVFRQIGSYHSQGGSGKAYAVVRITNSRNNLFENNYFADNRNLTAEANLLHSLYFAHESHNNIVQYNTFVNISGDPIRFRDYSNNNTVLLNKYIEQEYPKTNRFVSTWYCEFAIRDDCTSDRPECPSESNVVKQNRFVGSTVSMHHVAFDLNKTKCDREIDLDELDFKEEKNVNISNGECKIQALEACPRVLTHDQLETDYLDPSSSSSQTNCSKRASAYFGSCGKLVGDTYQNMLAAYWYKKNGTAYQPYSKKLAGKGCYVKATNCSRMKLEDGVYVQDFDEEAQTSESRCISSRLSAYYGSCAKLTPNDLRYVEMTYLNNDEEKRTMMGHGCVVSVDRCYRMGFLPLDSRVDHNDNSHTSAEACMERLNAWLGSCIKGEAKGSSVTVTMRYFQNGKLLKEESATRTN